MYLPARLSDLHRHVAEIAGDAVHALEGWGQTGLRAGVNFGVGSKLPMEKPVSVVYRQKIQLVKLYFRHELHEYS